MGLIVEGERIYLRPLRKSDSEDFCLWYNDNDVTRFLGKKLLSKGMAGGLFNRSLKDPNGVYFGIIRKNEARIISRARALGRENQKLFFDNLAWRIDVFASTGFISTNS
jgi:RimJ/RimL family protein N-acetyltransferase